MKKFYWYNKDKEKRVEISRTDNDLVRAVTTENGQDSENIFNDEEHLIKVLKQRDYVLYRVTYGL